LVGVKELVLTNCLGITDVSELGRVKKLEISNCENLNDLSALSTVHTLRVSWFPENLLSPLNQNTVLDISFFDLDFSSVEFLTGNKLLRELDISSNMSIRDISMLNSVAILNISHCPSIKSLIGLTALKELKMSGVERIETGFEVFQQLTKLTSGKENNWTQTVQALEKAAFLLTLILEGSNLPFESFIQVKHLVLRRCDNVTEFPATLIHLQSLEMNGCKNIVSFPVFPPSLQLLNIEGSNELSSLNLIGEPGSPTLHHVKISNCPGLDNIQISRKITSFEIRGCDNLKVIAGKNSSDHSVRGKV
jgi:hypothetical protein